MDNINNTNKRKKMKLITTLLIIIFLLMLGFAAYSTSLKILDNYASQVGLRQFSVVFTKTRSKVDETPIIAKNSKGASSDEAYINNTGYPIITNLNAKFTEPGQYVTYTFYAYNNGLTDAYLRNIIYSNIDKDINKKCISSNKIESLQNICNEINVKIEVNGKTIDKSTNVYEHALNKGNNDKIVITIEYSKNAEKPNKSFKVLFGNIVLIYSSVQYDMEVDTKNE